MVLLGKVREAMNQALALSSLRSLFRGDTGPRARQMDRSAHVGNHRRVASGRKKNVAS